MIPALCSAIKTEPTANIHFPASSNLNSDPLGVLNSSFMKYLLLFNAVYINNVIRKVLLLYKNIKI